MKRHRGELACQDRVIARLACEDMRDLAGGRGVRPLLCSGWSMVKRICYNTRYGNGTFNPCAALLRVALAALPTMTAFGQALPGTVSRTVEVYPGAEKNKAFPLERGSGMCDLTLRARSPWRIRDSNIVNPVSDETLWKKFSPTRYKMSYGYAPDEFVQIEGDLYKPTTGSGEGKVELPDFLVTVPAVNLDWDVKHGDAAKEFAEDSVPAAILVSSDRADFGSLIVDMKFGVEIGHKAGNLWQTRDVVYWYGVSPDRLGYNERFNYVFNLKCNGGVLKSKKLSVRWPEGNSHGGWVQPVSNDTTPGEILHYATATKPYWYCKIDFKAFNKFDGYIWTDGFNDFQDTSQYSKEIRFEEEYHVKQLRGEVDIKHGGQADCYTVTGLQYFVSELAKGKKYKEYITKFYEKNGEKEGCWGVKGESKDKVDKLARVVIKAAVEKEIAESNRVLRYNTDKNKGKRGYMELKAKEAARYNAAWLYRYTYLNVFGPNPKRMIHKAYQKPEPESYEVR